MKFHLSYCQATKHTFFIMLALCTCLGWSFLYISGAADGTTEQLRFCGQSLVREGP